MSFVMLLVPTSCVCGIVGWVGVRCSYLPGRRPLIDTVLRDPRNEAALLRRLEKRVRKAMERFSFFIYRFNNPVMKEMLGNPSNRLRIEQGVISMLAGDVLDTPMVLWRLRLFKVIYGMLGAMNWRRWRAEKSYRRAQARSEFTGSDTPVDST